MKLSTKGRYGLRAMLDLAEYGATEAVSTASIAKRQDISESYLEQLIRKLRNAGLVKSVRGAAGGYMLSRAAAEISIGDVLTALEGDLCAVRCESEEEGECCGRAETCASKIIWDRINHAVEEAVNSVTLQDLVEETNARRKDSEEKSRTVLKERETI